MNRREFIQRGSLAAAVAAMAPGAFGKNAGGGAKGPLNIGLIEYMEMFSNAIRNKKISRLVSRGWSCALPSTVPGGVK